MTKRITRRGAIVGAAATASLSRAAGAMGGWLKGSSTNTTPSSGLPAYVGADFYSPAATTGNGNTTGQAYHTFGQAFRMGDVPAGTHAKPAGSLTYQIEEISPAWPDSSMRHCVYTVLVPSATAASVNRISVNVPVASPYSPSSTPRTTNVNVVAKDFRAHYQGVAEPGTWGGDNQVPPTWTTIGSGNFSFIVNDAITAGRFKVTTNGPCVRRLYVYGFMTDDAGGTSDHLYCEYWLDEYIDPANTANTLYFEHMALISQPIINPATTTHARAKIGFGKITANAGSTVLRNMADDVVLLTPSDVDAGGVGSPYGFGNSYAATRLFQGREWNQINLIAGAGNALPGGISDGAYVKMIAPTDTTQPLGTVGMWYVNAISGRGILPTTTGTLGTGAHNMQLSARQFISYYNGFYITASDNGDPVVSAGTWTAPFKFMPRLDGFDNGTGANSQRGYWVQSGMMVPWDLTLTNSVVGFNPTQSGILNDGQGQGWKYRPGCPGYVNAVMNQGATSLYAECVFDEPHARWWVRMGNPVGSLSPAAGHWNTFDQVPPIAQSLTVPLMPAVMFMRAPIGTEPPRIIPWDNGPNNDGIMQYPGLGASSPTDYFVGPGIGTDNSQTGFWPNNADYTSNAMWGWGAFDSTDGAGAANYHWPAGPAFMTYMIFGRRYFLEAMRRSANRTQLQRYQGGNEHNTRAWTFDPPYNFYCRWDLTASFSGWNPQMLLCGASSILGSSADLEIPYFANIVDNNARFVNYLWGTGRGGSAYKPPGTIAANWVYEGNYVGFNVIYGQMGLSLFLSMTRNSGFALWRNMTATFWAAIWDDQARVGKPGLCANGTALYWSGGYGQTIGLLGFAPLSPPAIGVGGLDCGDPKLYAGLSDAGNGAQAGLGVLGDGTTFTYDPAVTNPIGLVQSMYTAGANNGPGIANDDEMLATGDINNFGQTPAIIAKLGTYPITQKFYVINLNTTTMQFKLTSVKGNASFIVTGITPQNSYQNSVVYRGFNDAPGFAANNGTGVLNTNMRRCALLGLIRCNAQSTRVDTSLSNALTTVTARIAVGTTFTDDIVGGGSPSTRNAWSSAIPLVPAITF